VSDLPRRRGDAECSMGKHRTSNPELGPSGRAIEHRTSNGGRFARWLIVLCWLGVGLALNAAPKKEKEAAIVSVKDGRLVYDADEKGNRVPDFSHCGYAGGRYRMRRCGWWCRR
jgi:hypothetical protein